MRTTGTTSSLPPVLSLSVASTPHGTWFVDHVVDPALALLHSQSSPLVFRHQVGGGHELRQLLRKHDVPEGRTSTDTWTVTSNEIYPIVRLHVLDVIT